jgi:hypothetical protein
MAPSWVTPEWPSCILSAPSALLAQKKVFYREKKKKDCQMAKIAADWRKHGPVAQVLT